MVIVKNENKIELACYTKNNYECFIVGDRLLINSCEYSIVRRLYDPTIDVMYLSVKEVDNVI